MKCPNVNVLQDRVHIEKKYLKLRGRAEAVVGDNGDVVEVEVEKAEVGSSY